MSCKFRGCNGCECHIRPPCKHCEEHWCEKCQGSGVVNSSDCECVLTAKCSTPKCQNKVNPEIQEFCDKHGGVIAGC